VANIGQMATTISHPLRGPGVDADTRRLPRLATDLPARAPGPALRGYAWWRIAGDGWLETFPGTRWAPGWNEASCRLYPRVFRSNWRRLHPAGVPGWFCLCGFHGSHLPQPAGPGRSLSARAHSGTAGSIFGVVEGAGPNVADRREWRAAFARPLSLYVPARHLDVDHGVIGRMAERYAVPILRDFDALVGTWGPPDTIAWASTQPRAWTA
jgi:hypothetical protein